MTRASNSTRDWPESFIADHQAKHSRKCPAPEIIAARVEPKPVKRKEDRIIRQSKGLNKTEMRFKLTWLDVWLHDGAIDRICPHESYKLPCGSGASLAPDFPTWKGGKLTCYEVKGGFIREDAISKLKACASLNPEISFWLCQWKGGQWKLQEVKP